jgi:hypothetical protein
MHPCLLPCLEKSIFRSSDSDSVSVSANVSISVKLTSGTVNSFSVSGVCASSVSVKLTVDGVKLSVSVVLVSVSVVLVYRRQKGGTLTLTLGKKAQAQKLGPSSQKPPIY